MKTFLWVFALTLVFSGTILVVVSSILLKVRAFKESLGWGLACLFLPLGTLLFVVRFWDEKKKLFFTQIAGVLLMAAGFSFGSFFLDGPNAFKNRVARGYDRREASRKKQEQAKMRDLERAVALHDENKNRARQLYGYLQNWQAELKAKSPGPAASAAQVEAFNREHARYIGLLEEYKAMAKALASPTPAR